MKRNMWIGAVATAITLAGCGTATAGAPEPSAAAAAPAVQRATYGLLGVVAPTVEVCASSTRAFFPLAQATDGKPSTAWTAEATDRCPALTFSWCEARELKKLDLKVSPAGTRVDVEAWDGRCWQSAGCYTPTAGAMWCTPLPCATAEKVRLSFKGCKVADLRVCEAGVETCAPRVILQAAR